MDPFNSANNFVMNPILLKRKFKLWEEKQTKVIKKGKIRQHPIKEI